MRRSVNVGRTGHDPGMRLRLLPALTTLLVALPASSALAAPNANTGNATGVTATTATLNGSVNPKGAATNGYFQYGTSTAYASRTPGQPLGNSKGAVAISATVTQLTPDTVYHYRAVGNGAGTTFGADRTFRTAKVVQTAPPEPSKLQLKRATISGSSRTIDVLAPITARASGNVSLELFAAGQTHRWTAPINSTDAVIRSREVIPSAQAAKGTGILTITYPGDADTRPQVVRLRAANGQSNLDASRPTITGGVLHDSGTVTSAARGVVRVQIEYFTGGRTVTLEKLAPIANGSWTLNTTLSAEEQAGIAARRGTVHSYILFTGYLPAGLRGEMQSYEVLGAQ